MIKVENMDVRTHWIAEADPNEHINHYVRYRCSACNSTVWFDPKMIHRAKYCMNCGAKMEEKQND